MSFWSELKRRNVYKVAVAYAIVAWLILQVASITFPALNLPAWALTLLTVFIIVCFPLVLIFAWAFEITPEGLKLTKDVPKHKSITHLTGQKLNYILIGVIVLAVAYILFDNFYLDKLAIQTEVESRVAELVPPAGEEKTEKTIAVLPFVNMSSDPEQDYFADGLSEEILNSLNKIPDLLVTARTSSFSFKGKDLTVQDIAPILGVAHVLEGSVRKAGNKLRVTAQLIRASDGFHLWSDQYDHELKDIEDILSIQGDIAKNVANELKITLGVGESFKQLGGTDNLEAYELYLLAKAQVWTENNEAMDLLQEALNIDPKFALAWALKGQEHITKSMISASTLSKVEQDEAALYAAQKAINLEPNMPEGYVLLGSAKTQQSDFIEAEKAYRKVFELTNELWSVDYVNEIIMHYLRVGKIKRAHEIVDEVIRNDPLNAIIRCHYVLVSGLIGDKHGFEKEQEHYKELFGDSPYINLIDNSIWYIRLSPEEVLSNDDFPTSISNSLDYAEIDLKKPEESLLKLRKEYSEYTKGPFDLTEVGLVAAYLGDPELAIDYMKRGLSVEKNRVFKIWLPSMKEVRQLPRFKELVQQIGLVDYWEQFGWPDLCHPTDDGDFMCN